MSVVSVCVRRSAGACPLIRAAIVLWMGGTLACQVTVKAPPTDTTASVAANPNASEEVAASAPPAPPDDSAPAPPANSAPEPAADDADSYQDNDPAALTDFRSALDPYGQWVDDPTYGTVWLPSSGVVGPNFTPYGTGGHWVHDDDWVWASDYDWGWAPFHYGRWVSLEGRGWGWIPGREYRGAWVTWGADDEYTYLGWAPAPPEFVWFHGAPVVYRAEFAPRWVYVPRGDIFSPAVGGRIVPPAVALRIQGRVHVVGDGRGRSAGPAPERFGYAGARVPHGTSTERARIVHAQQFSRPSTAQKLGARPPTRVASNEAHGAREPGRATNEAAHRNSAEPNGGNDAHATSQPGRPANQSPARGPRRVPARASPSRGNRHH